MVSLRVESLSPVKMSPSLVRPDCRCNSYKDPVPFFGPGDPGSAFPFKPSLGHLLDSWFLLENLLDISWISLGYLLVSLISLVVYSVNNISHNAQEVFGPQRQLP